MEDCHRDNIVFSKRPHELLKQAPPFLFIDRVESYNEGVLVCSKQICYNEPYLAGHFPGEPIVPGVLLVEMANQAGALLMIACRGEVFTAGYAARINKFTFYNQVLPGDILLIEVRLKEEKVNYFTVNALLTIKEKSKKAARGEVVLYMK